jgi:ribosomal protein S18 acetylase RimI-like enzyme
MKDRTAMATNMPVSVRLAGAADLAAVSALMGRQNHYHAELVPHIVKRVDPAESEKWCAGILSDPAHKIFLAESGSDEAVGLLMLHDKRYDESVPLHGVSLAFVDELFVVAAARRMGVARKLVEKGRCYAKEQGFAALSLNVWGANHLAVEAYKALGFETVYHRMALPAD